VKNKLFTDWTDADILVGFRNGGLATLIYQAQCDYVGPEHEVRCIQMLARICNVLDSRTQKLEAAVRDAKKVISDDIYCGVCENSSPIGIDEEEWLEKYGELVNG